VPNWCILQKKHHKVLRDTRMLRETSPPSALGGIERVADQGGGRSAKEIVSAWSRAGGTTHCETLSARRMARMFAMEKSA
jgi:hypothetical protein